MGTHLTACFFFGFAIGDGPPLVVGAPAPGKRDLDLRAAVLEVRRKGHQGERPVLGLAGQVVDLAFVQQELASPVRVEHAEAAGVPVGRHVHAVQPYLAVLGPGERVPQLHLALPEGLDLAADQHDPGLVGVQDVVFMACPAVLGHQRPSVDLLRSHRPIKGSFVGVLLLARPPLGPCCRPLPRRPPARGMRAAGRPRGRGARGLPGQSTPPARRASTRSSRGTSCAPTGPPEAAGWELIGVWHSHTHTLAYPSPTDIDQAPDPDWHYVLVSLSDVEPVSAATGSWPGR